MPPKSRGVGFQHITPQRNRGVVFQGRRIHVCARIYTTTGGRPVVGFSVTSDTREFDLDHLMELMRKRLRKNEALKTAGVTEVTVVGNGIVLREFSQGFDLVVSLSGEPVERMRLVLLRVLREMLGTERVRVCPEPLNAALY